MKWQHLKPFHVAHRRDDPADGFDVGWIVGQAGDEDEPDPHRLADIST